MGIDKWTRTPYEREYRAKEKAKSTAPRESTSLTERARRKLAGEGTCACGCRKSATAFRNGKMWNSACARSMDRVKGLPKSRQPPLPGWRKREIKNSHLL